MAQYVLGPLGGPNAPEGVWGPKGAPIILTAAQQQGAARNRKKTLITSPATPLSPLGCLSRRKGTPTEFYRGGVAGVCSGGAPQRPGTRRLRGGCRPRSTFPRVHAQSDAFYKPSGRFVNSWRRSEHVPRGRPATGALRLRGGYRPRSAAWGLPPTLGYTAQHD
jgi:hypothetical protein